VSWYEETILLISKVLSQLLLPPGGLILLAVLGLIYWRCAWGRGVVCLSLLLFWGLSTEPVRDALSKPLEFTYAALDINKLEANNSVIVLLGGGIYENAPEYGGADALRSYAMMRTWYAAYLAKQTGMDIYATGGVPLSQGDDAEGDVMLRQLIAFGLPEDTLFAESSADNTWQNASYIKKLLNEKHIKQIVLVTSAWHMPRAVWCFEKQGLEVVAAPTDYMTSQRVYDMRSYVPRWTVFSDSGQVLHEYLGLLWYQLSHR